MVAVELTKNEYDYLCRASFLPSWLKELLISIEKHKNKYLLKISENQADRIRDLFGEQLQLVGFDEKYELTLEGKILESLIDKFFIG
ncbi:MAG: hypothetical protein L0207_04165 [Chlamydiae bacterium]|nr:hypothetical protein [Chlamydiota bacterium]